MTVEEGARASLRRVVGVSDTAEALGSGSLPVLATPRLLAWLEAATCAALEGGLAEGATSVGVEVHVEHLAASAVGATVEVSAVVASVDGRRVVLDVEAHDGAGTLVGRGTVTRVVVDAGRFLDRLPEPDES